MFQRLRTNVFTGIRQPVKSTQKTIETTSNCVWMAFKTAFARLFKPSTPFQRSGGRLCELSWAIKMPWNCLQQAFRKLSKPFQRPFKRPSQAFRMSAKNLIKSFKIPSKACLKKPFNVLQMSFRKPFIVLEWAFEITSKMRLEIPQKGPWTTISKPSL